MNKGSRLYIIYIYIYIVDMCINDYDYINVYNIKVYQNNTSMGTNTKIINP